MFFNRSRSNDRLLLDYMNYNKICLNFVVINLAKWVDFKHSDGILYSHAKVLENKNWKNFVENPLYKRKAE